MARVDLKKMIQKNVLCLSGEESIWDTIGAMIDRGVSSALVVEEDSSIKGIVTERDIMRKLVRINVEGKLEKPIRTLMTVPVRFAYLPTITQDVINLHKNHNQRHFPILEKKSEKPTKDNLYGILTSTDLCRCYLNSVS